MRQASVVRPVTPARLGPALGVEPYELLAELIPRQLFLAPHDLMPDQVALEIAAEHRIELAILPSKDAAG